jgi:hypothetical protein
MIKFLVSSTQTSENSTCAYTWLLQSTYQPAITFFLIRKLVVVDKQLLQWEESVCNHSCHFFCHICIYYADSVIITCLQYLQFGKIFSNVVSHIHIHCLITLVSDTITNVQSLKLIEIDDHRDEAFYLLCHPMDYKSWVV